MSNSFYTHQMSRKCQELIDDAKLQEKPCEFPFIFMIYWEKYLVNLDLQLTEWEKNKYSETELCNGLFLECEDKIERRDCEDLSISEFLEVYEKGNKPLVIKNLTKKFFKESQWNYEVDFLFFIEKKKTLLECKNSSKPFLHTANFPKI